MLTPSKKFAKQYSAHIGIQVSPAMIEAMWHLSFINQWNFGETPRKFRRATIDALHARGLLITDYSHWATNYDGQELRDMVAEAQAEEARELEEWLNAPENAEAVAKVEAELYDDATDDTQEAEQSAPVATDTDSAPDTDTDDDAPWQTIYTGPYTIHTDTDSMTFEWRSEAEEMADLLTANGARITLDWNYRPIAIGEIVGINVKSYTPSPRWAVIGVMRNRLGLIVYVLQNEDGVTQQYYGLSILRLQPNTYHVPVVDILTVDIATAHLAEYMVNMHNMHPQMCNAMHDDLMSDMLDDLLDAKWREVTKRMHATHADDAPERLEMMFEYDAFAEWVSARKMTLEYATC